MKGVGRSRLEFLVDSKDPDTYIARPFVVIGNDAHGVTWVLDWRIPPIPIDDLFRLYEKDIELLRRGSYGRAAPHSARRLVKMGIRATFPITLEVWEFMGPMTLRFVASRTYQK